MSDDENPFPKPETGAPETGAPKPDGLSRAKLAEKQRLAEALRENLKRRKAQARGRRADAGGNSGPADK